jgi:hypothetical protein
MVNGICFKTNFDYSFMYVYDFFMNYMQRSNYKDRGGANWSFFNELRLFRVSIVRKMKP